MKVWDNYRLILALHRTGTLRGAADVLEVNHSTVSRRLSTLKQHVGGTVFERTAKGYNATPLGQELINAAQRMEQIAIESLRNSRALQSELTGVIKISVPPPIAQFLLMDEFKLFSQTYPDITLHINSSFHLADLDKSEADVIIRGSNHPPEHLVGHRIGVVNLNYYAQQDYFEKTDPAHYQWIGKSAEEKNPQWIQDSPFPDAPLGIRADDIIMRYELAKAGYGLTRTACYMAEFKNSLIRIGNSEPVPYADLWLLTHPNLKSMPRIKVLMAFLLDVLSKKRSELAGRLHR